MESNPECSLCVHAAEKVSVNKKCIGVIRNNKGNTSYNTGDIILGKGDLFATNSLFFPTVLVKDLPDFYLNCPIGDYPLTIYLSLKGEVFYIDDLMSAYRVMALNSWTSRMQGNLQKYIEHIKLMEKMLYQIDEYSNYIHTKAIGKCILENQFDIMIRQGKFKELKRKEYKEVYANLNIKSKSKIFLKYHFPGAANFFRRTNGKFL